MGPRLAFLALIIAFCAAAIFATLTTVRQVNMASSGPALHSTRI